DVQLSDLLQLFANNKKSGVLHLQCGGTYGAAHLALHQGQLQHVGLAGVPQMSPPKALSRLLALRQGTCALVCEPPAAQTPQSFADATETTLMEATRRNDEAARTRAKLAGGQGGFAMPLPLGAPLRQLSPDQLDLWQQALEAPGLQQILDHTNDSDEVVLLALLRLVAAGYLRPR
ncbi:MAG: DUF4388 domain-containing protein, partial [Deltaproteobacteria bacterium]